MSNVVIVAEFSHVHNYTGDHWEYNPIEGGGHYDLGSLVTVVEDKDNPPDMWAEVPYTASGDYSGYADVGISNYRVIEEEFKDDPDIAFVSGGYGFQAVIYRTNTKNQEILDMIKKLENYPLLDEDSHSHVLLELEDEAWDNWARHDFVRALGKKFPDIEDDIDALDNDAVFQIFNTARDEANEYWEQETSGAWIDIDKIVACVTVDDLNVDPQTND